MAQPITATDPSSNWTELIAQKIQQITGIQLGPRQSAMVESRLHRRLIQLGLKSGTEYLAYFEKNKDKETKELVALLTTHHTFFFREYSHFEYLERGGLQRLTDYIRKEGRKTLYVWSAACSQGQEAYSLAMFLSVHLKRVAPDLQFEILGTDVDHECVEKAKNGIYRWTDIKEIPSIYMAGHWMRGTGDIADFVKAKPGLKERCKFEEGNLLKPEQTITGRTFDIIFCRNVFIYFTQEQITTITRSIAKHLNPEGYFFIGTSESLRGLDVPLTPHAPSVYVPNVSDLFKKKDVTSTKLTYASPTVTTLPTPAPSPGKVRVLCVDDSPTILTLLKKLLVDDFEIVATAKNGLEATEVLKKHKVDVMTLDIHMPEQGGIEYLEKNYKPGHPPVVIVSSVPREDSGQAMRCLELGATDYVEKPSLNDLSQRADEIKTKIRCAAYMGATKVSGDISKSFSQSFTIAEPQKKIRLLFGSAADREKFGAICSELDGSQPPTIVILEGSKGLLPSLAEAISKKSKRAFKVLDEVPMDFSADQWFVADYGTVFSKLKMTFGSRPTSMIVMASTSGLVLSAIREWHNPHLIVEEAKSELGSKVLEKLQKVKYVVPYTSMAYHSNEFFAKGK